MTGSASCCQCAQAVARGKESGGHSVELLAQRPAYLTECQPDFGRAFHTAAITFYGSIEAVAIQLAEHPELAGAGISDSQLHRFALNQRHPTWLLAKYIIYYTALTSAFHRQCMIYGWVRNDFYLETRLKRREGGKGVRVTVPEELITMTAKFLLRDFHLFASTPLE